MNWNKHFSSASEVKWPINDAPVEAVIKVMAYWLRDNYKDGLKFLDIGCGGGATLEWLTRKGIIAHGVDVSEEAIRIAKKRLVSCSNRLSVANATNLPFENSYFNGIIESCAFQHLNKEDRSKAFIEVNRVLKSGGVFVGYCLTTNDDIFLINKDMQLQNDPGTVILSSGPQGHLQNIGLTHFFNEKEIGRFLHNFNVECLSVVYQVPKFEALRRGMKESYSNKFYVILGIKK
mgnify:CR=1 FL=1